MHKTLGSILRTVQTGFVGTCCNPSTWEVEEGQSEVKVIVSYRVSSYVQGQQRERGRETGEGDRHVVLLTDLLTALELLYFLPPPPAPDLLPEAACTLSSTVRGGGSTAQQRGHCKLRRKTAFPRTPKLSEPSPFALC